MQNTIHIGVLDRSTNEYFVATCTLPVLIGRRRDAGNQIVLDDQRVSRIHGVIEEQPHGQVYIDCSTRGSRVGGRNVNGSQIDIGLGIEIEIEIYTLSIVPPGSDAVQRTPARR